VQHKDFLRNLTTLGGLYTSDTVQDKDFLRNLTTLGGLYTSRTVQDKDFLRNASREVAPPFIYADGILSVIISTKQVDGITVHNTVRVGYSDAEYVATDGENYAHANSVRLAISDLRFKISGRDTSWLEGKTLNSVMSFDDAVVAYRAITGACSEGVEGFLRGHQEQDSYTIAEIIAATQGQYGSSAFKSFFNN